MYIYIYISFKYEFCSLFGEDNIFSVTKIMHSLASASYNVYDIPFSASCRKNKLTRR